MSEDRPQSSEHYPGSGCSQSSMVCFAVIRTCFEVASTTTLTMAAETESCSMCLSSTLVDGHLIHDRMAFSFVSSGYLPVLPSNLVRRAMSRVCFVACDERFVLTSLHLRDPCSGFETPSASAKPCFE